MYTGLQGHLTGGLKGGYLNGGLPGTFRAGFRGGILRVASRYFQRGLKGGGTLRRGFKIPSGGAYGGVP